MDACRSKTDLAAKDFKSVAPFSLKFDTPTGIQGVVTLKPSSAVESSRESSNLGGAVFTHYCLTALKRAGDRDRD